MLELMATCFRFDFVAKEERSALTLPEVPAATCLTKRPRDGVWMQALLGLDPDQYFISLLRDPRDVVASRHGRRPEVYWANLRQWNSAYARHRAVKDHPRVVEVRYEDLVRDPERVEAELTRRLPFLSSRESFASFHQHSKPSRESLVAMSGVRPLDTSSIGAWRDHLPRVAGQLEQHGPIDEALQALDYEEDGSWKSVLQGIEPDRRPSFWPEAFPPEFVEKRRAQNRKELDEYVRLRGFDNSNLRA
jgi:hypothetical protein